MANKKPTWLKMGMSLWVHGTKFKVIDCSNPKNTILETELGSRSAHNVVALFSSGHVKLTDAKQNDTLRIAELSVSSDELERANAIAKDFDNLPHEYGKLGLAMADLEAKYKVNRSTLARWKRDYLAEGVPGLFRQFEKKGGPGKKRLDPTTEAMIQADIKELYLVRTPKSIDETIRLIRSHFAAENIRPPSVGTIRNRIRALSENEVLKAQKGSTVARDQLHVSQDEHRASRPLQEVQIDHTPIDLQLLSSELRQLIGKAHITLIQDVYSRVILGLYIGLEHPSFLSVANALREAIFTKESVLAQFELSDDAWPTYGLMEMLHSDNAVEFDGRQMDHFCAVNRVEKQFRPIGHKEYGGHIESSIKAVVKHIHSLPGTTFSNIRERGDYDSEGNAQIDLQELRRIIYRWVVNNYNRKERDELGGLSPLQMWQKALDEGWHPRMPTSYDDFRFSLLPYEERRITRHGISLLGFKYSAPCLRHWRAREKPRERKKYRIYYDPLDMRRADFVHPDGSGVSKIALISLSSEGPISLVELKSAKIRSSRYPEATPDLHLAHQEEKTILQEAAKKNKKARKILEQRADSKSRAQADGSHKGNGFGSGIDYSRLPDWANTVDES
ncbi:putative transposase [Mariprofundus aestuarium]|uniref:Putative transposase n=1 Tax=Mariprofundus aestuarium TaxID=1921086 RepID=A0A2K8L0E7_MARES|nr:Mu transposase C-terminal domain-containing protein [Mariprofundus aestuarium]ATX80693.1 putative transposase [Mariprofundus aestuarium]